MERIRAPVGYQGGNWEPRATGGAARACGDIDDGVARDGQAMLWNTKSCRNDVSETS